MSGFTHHGTALALLLGFTLSGLILSGFVSAESSCSRTPDLTSWYGQGWGLDERNTRYQRASSIYRDNVSSLEVAWVFALDGGDSPHSWFAVSADTVFVASPGGHVYALDKHSGCERWRTQVGGSIRTGLTHGEMTSCP